MSDATASDAAMGIGRMIGKCHETAIELAEKLVEDVEPAQFFAMPHPTMNHPGFLYGHLALYPRKLAVLLGDEGAVDDVPAGWEGLFAAGAVCEPDAGRYPSKEAIMERFVADHAAIARLVERTPDSVLRGEMPDESRRERFPTVGAATNFLLNDHLMFHAGQVSAWRRAVGLGSVT